MPIAEKNEQAWFTSLRIMRYDTLILYIILENFMN